MSHHIYFVLPLLLILPPLPASAEQLRLEVGEDDVDVENRTIHFKLGTAASTAEIEVFSPEGELLHAGRKEYEQAAPGSRLSIDWPDLGEKGENFRAELKVTDTKGNWVGFQVIRFYLEVPHEEVVFPSGKWDITKDQESKLVEPLKLLKDAVAKYGKLMDVRLYVAGHTDTVGKAADNQVLSEKRARSIAKHFVAQGLKGIPIFARGFGEGVLAVKTKDNVDMQANRRAQYIISTFTPELAGPGHWQRIH